MQLWQVLLWFLESFSSVLSSVTLLLLWPMLRSDELSTRRNWEPFRFVASPSLRQVPRLPFSRKAFREREREREGGGGGWYWSTVPFLCLCLWLCLFFFCFVWLCFFFSFFVRWDLITFFSVTFQAHMSDQNIPETLQNRVRNFYEFIWNKNRWVRIIIACSRLSIGDSERKQRRAKERTSQGERAGARGVSPHFSSLARRSSYGPTNWGPGTG